MSKLLFQTIQFIIQKQFYFKQFSLAYTYKRYACVTVIGVGSLSF